MASIRNAGAVVVLVACMAAQVGCGLSTNKEPEPLAADDVPPELRDEGATGDLPPPVIGSEVNPVWFLQTDETGTWYLVPMGRPTVAPAGPRQRLEALIQQPPNEIERAEGIATFVREDARVVAEPRRADGAVLEVSLSESFYDMQGDSSRYAFAQVVFTATEIDGVDAVRFRLNGRNFEVVDGEGQSRSGPVDRDDYRNLQSDE